MKRISTTSTLHKGLIKEHKGGPWNSDNPKKLSEGGQIPSSNVVHESHAGHPHAHMASKAEMHKHAVGMDLRAPMSYSHRHK